MSCSRANQCNRLRDIELVHGGHTVCSYCEEWRKECLNRHYSALIVMSIRSSHDRDKWFDSYELQNGKLARTRLENEVSYRRSEDIYQREA